MTRKSSFGPTVGASLLATAFVLLFVGAVVTTKADAAVTPEVQEFSVTPTSTQANGHPDVVVHYKVAVSSGHTGERCGGSECLNPRIVRTHFPTGFIGDPHVVPECTLSDFSGKACPPDSQVGVADIGGALEPSGFYHLVVPVYNMETRPDQAGLVAFNVVAFGFPVFLELSGRTDSDYGLDSVSSANFQLIPVGLVNFVLWGIPAEHRHDRLRFYSPLKAIGGCFEAGYPLSLDGEFPNCTEPTAETMGVVSTLEERPYLQNPGVCDSALTSGFDVEYYNGTQAHAEQQYPQMTGCDQLSFNPSQVVKPTTEQADTPSGIDAELRVPQLQSPTTPSPSEIRTVRSTLPDGFSINPGAADGKVACGDLEGAVGTLLGASCPEFSKVGVSELESSALPAPIMGAVYLGAPKPGQLYRLIVTGDGFATHVKVVAVVHADPITGQLTTSFEDLPQTPLQRINLHIFGSERGLLATPEQCGVSKVANEFIPWTSGLSTRTATSLMTINAGPGGSVCPSGPRPFQPAVAAGTENGTAGRHTPFHFKVTRNDGQQNLVGVVVTTPPGFAATLRGVPYCPETAIALMKSVGYEGRTEESSPACPKASQVGTVNTGAGAGDHPLFVPGKVYLAGPYRGAPLSLVVSVPAISGPYDLGDVVVRVAIQVDPSTARVTAISDPLPEILAGIPLRTRYIRISLDRPDFTFNPTDCDPFSTDSTITADEGASAQVSTHFQVANCADLPYAPRLTLALRGGLRRRGHPAIKAVLRSDPGEANSRRISVTLPKGELLDNSHIRTVCTKARFASSDCPAGSKIGEAEVTTPVLDEPLTGSAYLRSSEHELPDIVLDLKGQVDIEAVAKVDSVNGRLRATFTNIPDVPVSRIVLNLTGGKKGLLINSESLCNSSKRATATLTGQNEVVTYSRSKLRVDCGSAPRRHRQHRKAGR